MADVVENIKKNVSKLKKVEESSSKESSASIDNNNEEDGISSDATWESLGLVDSLCQAVRQMKWVKPSKIQKEAIPAALQVMRLKSLDDNIVMVERTQI